MSKSCLEFVWPPVVAAGRTTVLNACAYAERLSLNVRLHLTTSTSLLLLDNVSPMLHAGHNTYRLEVAARPARSVLFLSMTCPEAPAPGASAIIRRPAVVPLLVLPEESVTEVNNLFDSRVRARLAQQPATAASTHTGTQAASSMASGMAAADVERINSQNLVVGQVYREVVLPLLQDMQVILVDAPYHVIRAACARMAPLLHAANMPRCLSVLRELVRTHNDIREDLFAPPLLAPTPLPSHAQAQPSAAHSLTSWMTHDVNLLAQANQSNASAHGSSGRVTHRLAFTSSASQETRSSGSTAAQASMLALSGRESQHTQHSQPQAITTRSSARMTHSSTRSSGMQSSIYYSMPNCNELHSSPLPMHHMWGQYMLSMDEFVAARDRSSDPNSHAEDSPGHTGPTIDASSQGLHGGGDATMRVGSGVWSAALPQPMASRSTSSLARFELARMGERDMPDTDEELDLLFASLEDEGEAAGSYSQQMVLTSFLPDHPELPDEHPLHAMVDVVDEHGWQLPVSSSQVSDLEVGTVIEGIMQAAQEASGLLPQLVRVPSSGSLDGFCGSHSARLLHLAGAQLSSHPPLLLQQPANPDDSQELPELQDMLMAGSLLTHPASTAVSSELLHSQRLMQCMAEPAGTHGSKQGSNSLGQHSDDSVLACIPVPSSAAASNTPAVEEQEQHDEEWHELEQHVQEQRKPQQLLQEQHEQEQLAEACMDAQDSSWSLLPALQRSWAGFEDSQHERRFRRFWSRHMRLLDATTMCLTLLVMFSALQHGSNPGSYSSMPTASAGFHSAGEAEAQLELSGSSTVAGLPHEAALVVVATMTAPLLVGTYLVVVHHKATLRHREAITAASRLLSSCLWSVVVGLGLTRQLPVLRLMASSRAWRFGIGQVKNACRPVLLRHVLVCSMLEAFCVAAVAHHASTLQLGAEMLAIWAASLATTAATDVMCRRAFTLTQQAKTASRIASTTGMAAAAPDSAMPGTRPSSVGDATEATDRSFTNSSSDNTNTTTTSTSSA